MRNIISKIRLHFFKVKYSKRNSNNNTWAVNKFDMEQVEVGKYSWGGINILNYDPHKKSKLKIGSFCSIASDVRFMLGGKHRSDRISTYLFRQSGIYQTPKYEENIVRAKDIVVESDVWIGYGVLILSGSHIGQGAIIGANSVVSGNVPPYAIYAGNRIIKYRFPDEIIEYLLKIDYDKVAKLIDKGKGTRLDSFFYEEVSSEQINRLLTVLEDIDDK